MANLYLCEDSCSFFIPTHVAPFSARPLSCLWPQLWWQPSLRNCVNSFLPVGFPVLSPCESACLRWLCWKALLTDLLHKWCWIQRTLKFDSPEFELLLCPLLASYTHFGLCWSVCKMGLTMIPPIGLTLRISQMVHMPHIKISQELTTIVIFISNVLHRKCVHFWVTLCWNASFQIFSKNRCCLPRNTIFFSSRTFRCFLTAIKLKCLSLEERKQSTPLHQFYLWNKMLWFFLNSNPPLCTVSLKQQVFRTLTECAHMCVCVCALLCLFQAKVIFWGLPRADPSSVSWEEPWARAGMAPGSRTASEPRWCGCFVLCGRGEVRGSTRGKQHQNSQTFVVSPRKDQTVRQVFC